MKNRLVMLSALGLLVLGSTLVLAHPHFNKTVTVKLPSGVEATITYNTTPANETHAANTPVGSFVTPRRPQLKLSAEAKSGPVTIPAGAYVIGAIKNSADDWTMALYPADAPRGGATDMSKMIKLESMYSAKAGKAEHMLIDITPGKGRFEGRAVLTLHFSHLTGTRRDRPLNGALTGLSLRAPLGTIVRASHRGL